MKHRFKAVKVDNPKLASLNKRKNRKRHGNQHMSKGAIRRLARRGGVKRISAMIYNEMRAVHRLFLEKLVRDSIIFCEYQKRKTIMAEDVVRAIKTRGQRLYGFDEKPFPFSNRTSARLVDDTESIAASPPQNIQHHRRQDYTLSSRGMRSTTTAQSIRTPGDPKIMNDGASTSRELRPRDSTMEKTGKSFVTDSDDSDLESLDDIRKRFKQGGSRT